MAKANDEKPKAEEAAASKTPVAEPLTPDQLGEITTPETIEIESSTPAQVGEQPLRLRVRRVQRPMPQFVISNPVFDPSRKPKDVTDELAERSPLKRWGAMFKRNLSRMDERSERARNIQRQQQASIFLNSVLFPYIEGYAEAYNVKETEILSKWIKEKKTLGSLIVSNKNAVDAFVNNPQVFAYRSLAMEPLKNATEADARKPETIQWWVERIGQIRPDMAMVIQSTPGGLWWVEQTLAEIVSYLKAKM